MKKVQSQYPASVIATAETARDNALTWQRNLNSENGRTTIKESKMIIDYAKNIQNKVRRGERDVILPLLAYYGTGRLWARKQNRLMRRQGNSNALG
ncbi:hypothetical protein [Selenomonas ruminantium]|uniref:hypothetical protein n=1 Tax=Selenomonas ruminantium TaxID=971 RepID=UPI001B7FD09A|nr:hypothetical protein [Selenomonas ruminantium]